MRRSNPLLSAILLVFALTLPIRAPAAPARSDAASGRDRDLVAWWDFEKPQNRLVSNTVPGGIHGMNQGAVWKEGGLEFDGVNDCVSIGQDRPLAALSTGSISVWFKFYSVRTGEFVQPIFYFGDPNGGADNSSLTIEIGHFWPDRKTRTLYFTIFGTPGERPTFCFDTNVDLDLDTWYHFVAVVGADFNTGYLNGVELTGRNYNFGGPHDSVFFDHVAHRGACLLGKGWFANYDNPSHFDGMIGDVRIYRRALDASEVAGLYDEVRLGGAAGHSAPGLQAARGAWAAPAVALLGTRPNPFNPSTRIYYSVRERSRVTLRIFGADGRLVATLWSGIAEPGLRELAWDGTDGAGRAAGSGVYFLRLDAGRESATTKMILGR